jgi:hypothetical protein
MSLKQDAASAWRRKTTLGAIVGLVLFCAASAQARDWATEMFDKTTHDFGVVARGAKVEHRFIIENNNEEDIRIESVTSSCHCTTPKLMKQVLKSWEKTELVVTLDTRSEPGRKDATIDVVFAAPYSARVQLHTHAFIRGDVVVQPGAVQFGSVNQGVEATREVKILYAIGRSDWQIQRVECANPHIEARVAETNRNSMQVAYSLTVKLKADTPPGYIQEPLMLVTNDLDPSKARVPVSVEGLVAAALTVRPASLTLGVAEIGKPVTSNLVVQGRAPFRITAVRSSDDRFVGKVPSESKAFHIIPVTFQAKDVKATPGKVTAKIRIETDLSGASAVEVVASVELVAADETKGIATPPTSPARQP